MQQLKGMSEEKAQPKDLSPPAGVLPPRQGVEPQRPWCWSLALPHGGSTRGKMNESKGCRSHAEVVVSQKRGTPV